jgi:hypothetical protein
VIVELMLGHPSAFGCSRPARTRRDDVRLLSEDRRVVCLGGRVSTCRRQTAQQPPYSTQMIFRVFSETAMACTLEVDTVDPGLLGRMVRPYG